jgi:hypothetical protein
VYEQDFILRQLRQLGDALARLLKLGAGTDSAAQLEELSATHVNLELGTLRRLPVDQLELLLSIGGTYDINRALMISQLLQADARLGAPDSPTSLEKALQLSLAAAIEFGGFVSVEHEHSCRQLLDALGDAPLEARTQQQLKRVGELAEAADRSDPEA